MKTLFSWVLLFTCIVLFGQNYTVKGKVLDFHNKIPISNAEVSLGEYKTNTNKLGEFSLENIPKGNYKLFIKHPFCNDFSKDLQINKDWFVSVNLEHHDKEIETVELNTIHKNSISNIQQSISKNDIQRKATDNLGNLISSFSGVGALKTGNNITKPIIHGLYGSRVVVMTNGVRLSEQEWGVEHAPSIDPQAFGKISVIKGAGTLKYSGDAIGGIVALEQLPYPKKDTIFGNIMVSGISNGRGGNVVANATKTWRNHWFIKTQGSYKKLGDISIPNTTLQNTGVVENSLNLIFGKRNFKNGLEFTYNVVFQDFGIFKGAHLGNPEDFYNIVNSGNVLFSGDFGYNIDNPKQNVKHHLAKVEAYQRFAHLGKFTFQYSFQHNERQEYDIRRGELSGLPSMDLRLITQSLKLENLLERENWQLETGISGSFQDNYPNPRTMARRLIPDYYRYDAALYSVFQYNWNKKLKTELAVRYDYNYYDVYKYYDVDDWEPYQNIFPDFVLKNEGARVLTRPLIGFHNFSANIGIQYFLKENLHFKFNLSRASRTPNSAELFADGLHHSAAIIERGNLLLKQEKVYQSNISINGVINWLEGFLFEINPYIMLSDGFINQIPTGVESSNRGVFPIWDYQQVKARIFGIDVDAQLKFTQNFTWKSQFSSLRGDDLTNSEPLILMAPTQFRNALELKWIKSKNAYIKAEHLSVLKQNRFPVRNFNIEVIENGSVVSKNVDYSSTPAAYNIFNLYAGIDVCKNLSANVSVQNLFNKEYREYLNRLRFFSPEMGRNVILTLHYQF